MVKKLRHIGTNFLVNFNAFYVLTDDFIKFIRKQISFHLSWDNKSGTFDDFQC